MRSRKVKIATGSVGWVVGAMKSERPISSKEMMPAKVKAPIIPARMLGSVMLKKAFSGGAPIDTAAWGIELELVGTPHRVPIPGVWLASLSPWTLSFSRPDTTAWPAGSYEVRLIYISPEATPRRFVQPLGLVLEVTR